MLEGEVTLDRAYALEEHELAAGFVLTCQAHPTTGTVRIDSTPDRRLAGRRNLDLRPLDSFNKMCKSYSIS
jgi:hypothetical protein